MSNSGQFVQHADRALLESFVAGPVQQRRSEEELFNRYVYFIREGINKFNLSEDDAFDAYSDAVVSAIEKIIAGNFEGKSSLKTWLYRIFHNKCVDLIRKKTTNKQSIHRTESISDMLFHLSDGSKTVVEQMTDLTDWMALKQQLDNLGGNCRELLLLWAEGHSDKEILSVMEYKSANVVKTSRLRCLDKLRQMFHGGT